MPRKICSEKACFPIDAIKRLVGYYRDLKHLKEKGINVISSFSLSEILGVSPEQIRKDLSYLGEFGKRGVGYDVEHLIKNLEDRLTIVRPSNAVICGVGRLGMALMGYAGFRDLNIRISAGFDVDEAKIGMEVAGIKVYHLRHLVKVCKRIHPEVAIISVPASYAQDVCDRIISVGVRGILNFAPVSLSVPNNIFISNVDLSVELGALLFCTRMGESGGEKG